MAQVELGFAIVSNYFITIDTEDFDLEPGEWENMTTEEKSEWVKDHEGELLIDAERESSESLGNLEQWKDLDTEEEEYFI